MYSYFGADITPLRYDHKETIVHISAEHVWEDRIGIERDCILLSFVYAPHRDPFLNPSYDVSSDSAANSKNAFIDPEQPPVRNRIYSTPHLGNRLVGNSICNEYFDASTMELIHGHHFLARRSME